jgi:hypothetical protein
MIEASSVAACRGSGELGVCARAELITNRFVEITTQMSQTTIFFTASTLDHWQRQSRRPRHHGEVAKLAGDEDRKTTAFDAVQTAKLDEAPTGSPLVLESSAHPDAA